MAIIVSVCTKTIWEFQTNATKWS